MQIYIHIPFCEQKCSYCRFASVWNSQEFLIEKYVRYLSKEIETSKYSSLDKREVTTIYFWWWTPGVLTLKQLKSIFTTLKNKFTFAKNIEISLESTPDRVTIDNVEWWIRLWITRLSMWVQTLNKKSLELIWRGNKWDIETALENIKVVLSWKLNLDISLDFIIWLPHVEKWEIKKDIQKTLKKYNFVKHISVYMLEDYYNEDKVIETTYDKKTYPDNWNKLWVAENDYLEEYVGIKKYLESMWFHKYEISNFSKSWYECKHNKWYWTHSKIVAFWLWAYWFVDWIRYANSEKFWEYYAWKKILEEKLSDEDLFLETVMFQLRTSWLDKKTILKLNKEKINNLLEEKYLEKKSDKIILSDKWVMVMDYILSEII